MGGGLSQDEQGDIVADAIQIEGSDGTSRAEVVTRGDGKKAIAVDGLVDPTDEPGVPCFTTKLRIDFDGTDTTLTSSYQTIFSYTGSGKFVAFAAIFEGTGVTVKFTIDSEVVFEIALTDLQEVSGNKEFSIGTLFTDAGGKEMFFQPGAICYGTDVKIEAKDSGGKKVFAIITELTKET